MTDLLEYVLRITPGLVLLTAVWWLLRDREPVLRIMVLVLGFVLMRDAMTPLGFWSFGLSDGGVPWIRFADDPVLLIGLGVVSVALALGIHAAAPGLRRLVDWGRPDWRAALTGLVGAAVVLAPFALLSIGTDVAERGGAVRPGLVGALAVMALGGNFLEEVLFRGYLQGHLRARHSALRTVLLSGLLFAAGHVFLASTVTDVGWPLLAFTLLEGLVCAEVARRRGVIASALTHGLVILTLAAGVV